MTTVSVIIATIPPRAEMLARARASVDAQTRQPDQVIIQLDVEGAGAGLTRNAAIAWASGDYLAILDDDDEFMPRHLELLVRAAKNTRADVVYSWFEHVGWPEWTPKRPDPLAVIHEGKLTHPLGVRFGPEQAQHMRRYAFIPACLLLRRSKVLEVGGYPGPDESDYEQYNGCEDWALLIRLLDAGARFYHLPQRTWRLHHGQGTAGRSWTEALA